MDRARLQKIIAEMQYKLCTSPLSVPSTKNFSDENPEHTYAIQEKFLTLPDAVKNSMTSENTSQQIEQIGSAFNLERSNLADISRAVRSYYFGELKLEDMPFLLAKEIPIELSKAQEITKLVVEKIINDKSAEQANAAKLETMTLNDAIKAYPEIGEQLITSEKITLRNFPEPVRPSLKNWLADYTFNLGFEKHSSIERGNYLFQGSNAKKMTPADRQKLSFILKAYDENTTVTINKDLKQIVFATPEQGHSVSLDQNDHKTPSVQSASNGIQFSSPQKLPYEKLHIQRPANNTDEFVSRVKFPPVQQQRPATPVNNIVRLEPKPEPPRNLPRNLVNLREE